MKKKNKNIKEKYIKDLDNFCEECKKKDKVSLKIYY
jgi:hypothetical protein